MSLIVNVKKIAMMYERSSVHMLDREKAEMPDDFWWIVHFIDGRHLFLQKDVGYKLRSYVMSAIAYTFVDLEELTPLT